MLHQILAKNQESNYIYAYQLRARVPKLSLAMYPFSILIDEHVPQNF